jgi:serine/threonine protein kinase
VLYSYVHRRWKIADFGFVTEASRGHSDLGRGTRGYRSPELLEDNKYNDRSDIWAFGCIVYEMCTGKMRFSNDILIRAYAREEDATVAIFDFESSSRIEEGIKTFSRNFVTSPLAVRAMARPAAADLLKLISEMGGSEAYVAVWES